MIVLYGESGSGKDTVLQICEELGLIRMVSYTTRPPRVGEQEGREYHFVSEERFLELMVEGFFAEHVVYNGNYYGSPLPNEEQKERGVIILETHGLEQMRRFDIPILAVYIYADTEIRKKRMVRRGDAEAKIEERLETDIFRFGSVIYGSDYVIVNDTNSLDFLRESVKTMLKNYQTSQKDD